MANPDEQLSGLAGEIRSCTTSEQFDLAGYTEARVHDLFVSAFRTPLTAPAEMVRFTFLVGGGKLVRARYSEDLPKWAVAALRAIGFSEDRSAAETFDAQGTFKQQHDTGQNLKYVVVYPHVACASTAAGGAEGGEEAVQVNPKSPEYIVCAADLAAFQQRVNSKTSSWRQCRRLLKLLQENAERIKAIEEKLCSGAVLSPREQALYESNSGADAEKIAWLQGEIKKYVEEGRLTASEKAEVIASLEANLATLAEKIAEASAEGKPKKVEKLEEMKKEGLARKAAVEKVQPIQLRLKHGDEVQRLRLLLLPLIDLEQKGRSMSLTMDDLKKLKDKSDIEEDIAALEASSRGWFEADEDFQARCAYEAKAAQAKHAAKLKAAKGKGSAGSGGQTWATIGASTGKKTGGGGSGLSAAKARPGFASLSLDNDD